MIELFTFGLTPEQAMQPRGRDDTDIQKAVSRYVEEVFGFEVDWCVMPDNLAVPAVTISFERYGPHEIVKKGGPLFDAIPLFETVTPLLESGTGKVREVEFEANTLVNGRRYIDLDRSAVYMYDYDQEGCRVLHRAGSLLGALLWIQDQEANGWGGI